MTSFRRLLTMSTLITLAGIGFAQAQSVGAGEYNFAIGSQAPCAMTLAADGTATVASTCSAHASDYSHWVRTPTGVQFENHANTVVAVLKAKGDGYVGQSLDSHKVTLTPAAEASAH